MRGWSSAAFFSRTIYLLHFSKFERIFPQISTWAVFAMIRVNPSFQYSRCRFHFQRNVAFRLVIISHHWSFIVTVHASFPHQELRPSFHCQSQRSRIIMTSRMRPIGLQIYKYLFPAPYFLFYALIFLLELLLPWQVPLQDLFRFCYFRLEASHSVKARLYDII